VNGKRTLYDDLEIDPGATEDEIRRAFKQLSRRFDPGGTVVYGLYRTPAAMRLVASLKDAYNTLLDPEARRQYDRSLFPTGHPSLRRADERVASGPPTKAAQKRTMPADPLDALGLPDDVTLRGPVITQVRGVCGITLEDIAERTKISMYTLRCIESEEYGDLPAPVYLRGFLKQIATMLHLDAARLTSDYMAAVQRWQVEEARKKPW
jgi:flagellar biosynthesis protein FlhG